MQTTQSFTTFTLRKQPAAFMRNEGVTDTTEVKLEMLGSVLTENGQILGTHHESVKLMSGEMSDRLHSKCVQLFTYL